MQSEAGGQLILMCLLVLEITMRPRLLSRHCSSLAFVPKHRSAQEEDIYKLQQFLDNSEKLVVITGAGKRESERESYLTA